MALTYPLDIMAAWPGWTTDFELVWRQEQSRQANGVTRVKDFGTPLWRTKATTKTLTRRELDQWRARLDALDGGLKTFLGRPMSRKWPIAYPGGSWPTGGSFDGVSAAINSLGDDNKSISLKSLPAGYVVSVGDMFMVSSTGGVVSLLRAMETVTADAFHITDEFEVRPGLPAALSEDDVVAVKSPYCLMTIVPGSLSATADMNGTGKISFEAIEAR